MGAVFWRMPAEDVLGALGAGPDGLSTMEATARRKASGFNEIAAGPRYRLVTALARRLLNPMIAILLVAAALAGVTGDRVSFAIIVLVVLFSTILDMVQERRAEACADALRRSIALRTSARRDAAWADIPVRDLVPGDVVRLAAGDLVPADGIVLAATAVQVNEAALTGEPYPVEKHPGTTTGAEAADASGALFHGTSLVGGSATMLVVATGATTRFGKIAASLATTPPPTAFERGIRRLGLLILRLTIFLVLFVLLAHLVLGRPPLQSFLFAMALAVGLTPELLPMIMTVALARGAQRLALARVVVKRLSAIHDLGEMDILCTDKTGTLTEACIALVGHPGIEDADDERVVELAAVNARFETGLKSPLDEALLQHSERRDLAAWSKIDEKPFDFERRRVSVLAERDGQRIEIVKGAPEAILAICTRAQRSDGMLVALDPVLRTRIQAQMDSRATMGLRLLAIAWRDAHGRDRIDAAGDADLIFSGLCVFVDPPKPSAAGAIQRLAAAGVRVKVISGDAAAVVEHVVGALGLPARGVLTGDEIATLSAAALAARVEDVDLFARITPDQKTRIVQALRARGHVVGFIGDGINDAPAIRAADVGLSVDGATDVAREAADMILLAPDLNVLAEGVAEGRRTYANIMKYLKMGTSSNFGNMLTMAIASLWLPFLPLTPVQVLINNLIYDLSQTGLPFDRADAADLARPRGWNIAALLRFTAVMGPLSSLFDLATFAILLGPLKVDIPTFRAAWFIESMATQVLVIFVIRTAARCWSSRPDPVLCATSVAGLAGAIALPFVAPASLLGFAAPPAAALAVIALLVLAYLGAAELLKSFADRPTQRRG